jgi:hypothetical protein
MLTQNEHTHLNTNKWAKWPIYRMTNLHCPLLSRQAVDNKICSGNIWTCREADGTNVTWPVSVAYTPNMRGSCFGLLLSRASKPCGLSICPLLVYLLQSYPRVWLLNLIIAIPALPCVARGSSPGKTESSCQQLPWALKKFPKPKCIPVFCLLFLLLF